MPYILSGSFENVLNAFGEKTSVFAFDRLKEGDDVVQQESKLPSLLDIDINRSPFFGPSANYTKHLDAWKNSWTNYGVPLLKNYSQGDMWGGAVFKFLSEDGGKKVLFPCGPDISDEDRLTVKHNFQEKFIAFGYIDDEGVASSFGVYYDPNPSHSGRWIVTVEKNINLPRDQRQVSIITPFDLKQASTEFNYRPVVAIPAECKYTPFGPEEQDELEKSIKNTIVADYCHELFNLGGINLNADIFGLFCFTGKPKEGMDTSPLVEALKTIQWRNVLRNPALRTIKNIGGRRQEDKLNLTPEQLVRALDSKSNIYQFFNELSQADPSTLSPIASVYLSFDAWGILDRFEEVKSDDDYIKNINAMSDPDFLAKNMKDRAKFDVIRFLAKTSSVRLNQLIGVIQLKDSPEIWSSLQRLAALDWNFPRDGFAHLTLCHLAINYPQKAITQEMIAELSELSSLSDQIDPVKLAHQLDEKDVNAQLGNILAYSVKITNDSSRSKAGVAMKQREILVKLFTKVLEHLPKNEALQLINTIREVVNGTKDVAVLNNQIKELTVADSTKAKSLLATAPLAVFASLELEHKDLALEDFTNQRLQNIVDNVEQKLWSGSTANSEKPKRILRKEIYRQILNFLQAPTQEKETIAESLMSNITTAQKDYNAEIDFKGINEQIELLLNPLVELVSNRHPDLIDLIKLIPKRFSEKLDQRRFVEFIPAEGDKNEQFAHALASSLVANNPVAAKRMEISFNYILDFAADADKSTLLDKVHDALESKNTNELAVAIDEMKRQGRDYSLLLEGVTTTNSFAQLNIDKISKEVFSPEVKGKVLRKVVKILDTKLAAVKASLSGATGRPKDITEAEQQYRKAMYNAVVDYLDAAPDKRDEAYRTFEATTQQSVGALLKATDVDRKPLARMAAMVVTNLISVLLTAGIGNLIHYGVTGNALFYGSTNSSKAVVEADEAVLKELKSINPSGMGG